MKRQIGQLREELRSGSYPAADAAVEGSENSSGQKHTFMISSDRIETFGTTKLPYRSSLTHCRGPLHGQQSSQRLRLTRPLAAWIRLAFRRKYMSTKTRRYVPGAAGQAAGEMGCMELLQR